MNTVENRFIAIICIIYSVGVLGFLIPSLNPLFLKLTPFNLIGGLRYCVGISQKMGSKICYAYPNRWYLRVLY